MGCSACEQHKLAKANNIIWPIRIPTCLKYKFITQSQLPQTSVTVGQEYKNQANRIRCCQEYTIRQTGWNVCHEARKTGCRSDKNTGPSKYEVVPVKNKKPGEQGAVSAKNTNRMHDVLYLAHRRNCWWWCPASTLAQDLHNKRTDSQLFLYFNVATLFVTNDSAWERLGWKRWSLTKTLRRTIKRIPAWSFGFCSYTHGMNGMKRLVV